MNENQSNTLITAQMTREAFKHVFSALVGKPDSKVKMFFDPIIITPNDVIELNKRLVEKLKNHDILEVVTSVDITYKNNEKDQFSAWDLFVSKNWKSGDETQSVNINWDFLIKLPRMDKPQHHGLAVKIASQFAPLHMMRAIFSEDPKDLDRIESEAAPIICRVDFINNVLADELLNIVEEWVDSIVRPTFQPPIERFLEKNKETISKLITYLMPLTFSFVLAGILNKYIGNNFPADANISIGLLKQFMYWLLFSVISLFAIMKIGENLGDYSTRLISRYGRHYPINFTNGDQTRINKIKNENKNSLIKITANFLLNLLLNILYSAVSLYLFK